MKILSMSGFIPEHICDIVRFTQYHGDRNIQNYCGYASDYISQVLNDNSIDGAVFPRSCDSARAIAGYLSKTDKFIYQMAMPINGDAEYFASKIKDYKEAVEKHYDVIIDDVEERCELINKRNEGVAKAYSELTNISFAEYLMAIHEMLKKPLKNQVMSPDLKASNMGKPVYVIGSFLSNVDIAVKIENAGLKVIGDNLTESGRLISVPKVELSDNVYLDIANSYMESRLSPTQNNYKKIMEYDLAEMKRKGVAGAIFITQKYCEPYDYLYSIYKTRLDNENIPSISIKLNDTEDSRKADLILEAFADSLR